MDYSKSHRSKKMTIVEVYCPHMLRSIFGPPEVPLLALFQFAVIFIEVAHMMRLRDSAQGNISHDESVFSINIRGREGGHTVRQNGSIAPLQEHSQFAPEMPHRLLLVLARLPGQSCPEPLHLPYPHFVPPPKDSTALGRKATPCLWHASALIFLFKACVRACPTSVAAPTTVATCRGLTTVTLQFCFRFFVTLLDHCTLHV